jgi:hypothetical protein
LIVFAGLGLTAPRTRADSDSHALVMLPYYDVFDNLAFGVNGADAVGKEFDGATGTVDQSTAGSAVAAKSRVAGTPGVWTRICIFDSKTPSRLISARRAVDILEYDRLQFKWSCINTIPRACPPPSPHDLPAAVLWPLPRAVRRLQPSPEQAARVSSTSRRRRAWDRDRTAAQ